MGERICPYCGAHLDPDERCDCRGTGVTDNIVDRGNTGKEEEQI